MYWQNLDALISDVRMHQSILDNRMVVVNALAQIDSLRTALAKEQDINHQLSPSTELSSTNR
jgi:hypothetical protein